MQSSFRNLKVWQRANDLVLEVYKLTQGFPKEEMYGLISQLRRCAVSVPSNIAEGSERSTKKDFANFLRIAKGSLAELETQLYIATKLEYLSEKDLLDLMEKITEIRKMLSGLLSNLLSSD